MNAEWCQACGVRHNRMVKLTLSNWGAFVVTICEGCLEEALQVMREPPAKINLDIPRDPL